MSDTFADGGLGHEHSAVQDTPESVGETLARARTALGLSIEDVAQQLKYGARQIEALEQGRFDRLHGATFARGMVRSYARLVKLDPQPLLARIADRVAKPAPIVSSVPFRRPIPFSNRARRSTLAYVVLTIVIFAVGAIVAVEWHQERPIGAPPPASVVPSALAPRPKPPGPNAGAARATVAPAAGTAATASIVGASAAVAPGTAGIPSAKGQSGVALIAPVKSEGTSPSAGIAAVPSASASNNSSASSASALNSSFAPSESASASSASNSSFAPSASVSNNSLAPTPNAQGAAVQASPINPTTAASNGASTATSAHRIVLAFDSQSWVQVKDASGRTLFSRLNPGGSQEVVHGNPPFSLVIGNARQVRVTYDGHAIDLTPYINNKDDVAHLTLG